MANRSYFLGHPNSQTKLRRGFPLTEKLKTLLGKLEIEKDQHERVFWKYTGDPRRISKQIRQIREKCDGLPNNLTLHTLRHTFASHLVMSGVDLSTVASLLGHSAIQVTEMYSHLQPDHILAAADRLPFYKEVCTAISSYGEYMGKLNASDIVQF